ncbi:MAG: hypothetical protein AABY22_00425 [Nanoarchaeota archaeon]
MKKNCLVCGKEITTRGATKYCSGKCYGETKIGHTPWNKGIKHTPEMKARLNMEGLKLGRQKGIKKPTLSINNPMFREEIKQKVHSNPNVIATQFKKGEHIGENSFNWKGNKVGYYALHDWVKRKLGFAKNGHCKNCKTKNNLEWTNISLKYRRKIDDWMILCAKCHDTYDRKEGWGMASKKFPEIRRKY